MRDLYSFKMGLPETKCGREGWTYEIVSEASKNVITCWAVGNEQQVIVCATQSINNMNYREKVHSKQNRNQKMQTMSQSYH